MSDFQNQPEIQEEPILTNAETTKPKDDGSDTDPDPYCCAPKDPGGPDGTP